MDPVIKHAVILNKNSTNIWMRYELSSNDNGIMYDVRSQHKQCELQKKNPFVYDNKHEFFRSTRLSDEMFKNKKKRSIFLTD